MNEQKREQISALIDDELTDETSSVIDGLLEDNEAKKTWERYHLIGDSLRGHLPERYENTADRVSSAIAAEPTILAPRKKSLVLMKPVVGFAIAASVAAVAIFNVQQAKQIPETARPAIAQSSIATNPMPIASSQLVTQQKNQGQIYQSQGVDPRLSRYLVNYNEYRANTGISGMPPHVRMVANDAKPNK
jgi:sigma-E factor negative regulatory protein RseA